MQGPPDQVKAGELLALPVSFYKTNYDTQGGRTPTLGEVLDLVRQPTEKLGEKLERAKALYEEIETAPDGPKAAKRRYQDFKLNNLPVFTVRGVFPAGRRLDAAAERANPLLVIDIDGLEGKGEEPKRKLAESAHTLAVFDSPSGDGVKAVIAVRERGPCTPKSHVRAWREAARTVERVTGLKADPTGKNLSRTCYVSGDPGILVKDPEQTVVLLEIPDSQEREVTRTGPAVSGHEDLARRMTRDIPVPEDYNRWYGIAVSLKSAGLSLPEAEGWSARGSCYEEGEIAKRWETMQYRTQAEALRHLSKEMRDAKACAVREGSPPAKDIESRFSLGRAVGKMLRDRFRYDGRRAEWNCWGRNRWTRLQGPAPHALADAARAVARRDKAGLESRVAYEVREEGQGRFRVKSAVELTEAGFEEALRDGSYWAGVRNACLREENSGTKPQLATPDGVYLILTGETEPHNPARHDTRGLMAGRVTPEREGELRRALEEGYGGDVEELLREAAGALAALAEDPESLALYDAPGQDRRVNLIAQALGQRAAPVLGTGSGGSIFIGRPGEAGTAAEPGPGGGLEFPGEISHPQAVLDAVTTLGVLRASQEAKEE